VECLIHTFLSLRTYTDKHQWKYYFFYF